MTQVNKMLSAIKKRVICNSTTFVMAISPGVLFRGWLRLGVLAALLGNLALQAAVPDRGDWWGTVTWVVDGDTVRVRPLDGGSRPVSVRLNGIDAPEICQDGGIAARDALQRQLQGQRVLVSSQAHDRYGRVLARLKVNGQDPAARLVALGWAWSYQYQTGQGPYATQQRQAEARHLGLFAGNPPEKPAAFRKRHGACPYSGADRKR
jgi:endonuclease YncB( thermonuclease family)